MPASGHQDHTTSPSALVPFVKGTIGVHRIPFPTSVTIASRPSLGTGRSAQATDLGGVGSKIFLREALDRFLVICPSGQIGLGPFPVIAARAQDVDARHKA